MEKDRVLEIKNKPFGQRSNIEKREIVKQGRPTPRLKTKVGSRIFQARWYDQIDWLCASSSTEKLYCWPCLLMQPKPNHSWTDGGYNNFKNILSDFKSHSKSLSHLSNYKCWKTYEQLYTRTAISKSAKLKKESYNKLVEENREYLSQLIRAVLYLCKQELPLHGHAEKDDRLNRGNFRELLHCFAEIDSVFASKLTINERSKLSLGVSNTMLSDIVQAIDKVIGDEIKAEVERTSFISLQADKTTDCAMHPQLSIIIRYVSGNKVCHRFLGFYEGSDDQSASQLVNIISTVLGTFNDAKNKLVSHTYDGAVLMIGEQSEVQSKLECKGFRYAHFIYCYAHKLSLVLSQYTEKIDGVKMFFSHVCAFSKFISSNTRREAVFKKFNITIPSSRETRWCYRSRTISAIKLGSENFKRAFNNILEKNEKWDDDTLCEAENLLAKLNDFKFIFFINCFDDILSQAEKLSDVLQCRPFDMAWDLKNVNEFIQYVENYRIDEHYENIVHKTMSIVEHFDDTEATRKITQDSQAYYKKTYFKLIDSILTLLHEQFACIKDYMFLELLDMNKFEEFANSFPLQHIESLQNLYPDIFDCKSLINELKYLYIDNDFNTCNSLNALLELIKKLELSSALSECVKLIQLVLTIPVTPLANERSFSTLNRARSYLRSTTSREQLSTSLARISVEKQILDDLKNKRELHDRVLQEFAVKPRRLEFVYDSSQVSTGNTKLVNRSS